MPYNSPQEVLSRIAHAYYEERNLEAVLSCVTDDVVWVGTENTDHAKGKAELKTLIASDFAAFPHGFCVALDEPSVQPLGDSAVMVTVVGKPQPAPGTAVSAAIRGTLCCVKTGAGWLVAHGHTSVPSAEIENLTLKNALEEERIKLKTLLDNVPGGVAIYRVKKDGRIPTDYVSDGLAKICGYRDSADILRVMGYDSRTMVVAEDYPLVAAACKASLEKGVPTSVQYRIHGKDGSPVHITLDSVIMKNARLGPEDAAVFYAVQTLVSEEATQKEEHQKTLISLLNTVPAGIGIFDVDESGVAQNYLNDAFYRLLDTRREERTQYTGANALTTAHPADVDKLKQAMKQLLDGAESTQLDYRVKGGQGNWVWLHLTACVVRRSAGSVRAYAAFYECTESKRQQLQLLQNQKAVTLAEQQGRLAIWTYNLDKGVILQQTMVDNKGHMGYAGRICNVPNCFVEDGVHPEDVDKFLAAYQKLEDGAESVAALYRLKDQNTGRYNWIRMVYRRTDDDEDGERLAVGFSIEVNKQQEAVERYEVEQKLREQMYDSAMIYTEYNLTNLQYVGKNNLAERYLSQQWEEPSEAEYRQNLSANVEAPYLDEVVGKMYAGNLLRAFERGETRVCCEYRSKARADRPALWCRITAVMVKRPDTGDVMAFVYVEDIETEKDRQLAIESSLSDGVESVIMIRPADGQSRVILRGGVRMPPEQEGHRIYDDDFVERSSMAVVPEDRPFSYEAGRLSTILQKLAEQEIYQYAITTKIDAHTRKRQLFRFRYLDDRKSSIVMSISDITAVYREELSKKRKLEAALHEAQKASRAKAEFYSRMSHDMRTPMNGVLGMVALSEDETDSAKLKENMGKIKESGEYLLSLINDTLDLQRIESGRMKLEPTIVSTQDLVRNIVEMISVSAREKGVALKYSKGNADLNWYIRADALRLKQIFINLLSNAVKFTPPGGTVAFEFELLGREDFISHDVVYVRDTGVGMSKEFLENGIFKPFSQERNAVSTQYAGSGLGLSIAKSLVEMMGGRIEVESELGAGTTFAVYLDFQRVSESEAKAALQREKNQSRDVSAQLRGKRILLAEDHPLNAEIAKKLLQKAGCEVTWAQDGQQAVACFAAAPLHGFDAVLMDIRMPVMDGLEATRRMRALARADAKTVPVIAMTANAYDEDRKACFDAGMNAHLGKPIEPKIFYDTLAMYLHKEGETGGT